MLLDVDGTLADTEEVHRGAFNSAFAEAGLDWNWSRDLYHELLAVTGGKERIRYFLDAFHAARPVAGISDEYIAQLHARKTVFYTAALAAGRGTPVSRCRAADTRGAPCRIAAGYCDDHNRGECDGLAGTQFHG